MPRSQKEAITQAWRLTLQASNILAGALKEKRVCEVCGAQLATRRTDAKYCSDSCKTAAYRDRQPS